MRPPASSPRMISASPAHGAESTFEPTDRSLPSRGVTADTLTQAFVDFILYCNPNFPLDVDTSTLRTNFQTPPKSDNKDFEIWRLFELLRQFNDKEIKTWAQLALELGVEAPDVSKGQSVQKVQQYTVRLKRWMHAMHIDAFFEYLFGKQHSYFTEVPPLNDPYPANGRDGVIAEEDLAIRALDPSFRPKRGRRRNSETEQDDHNEPEARSKQQRLMDSAAPMSALPFGAHPDGYNDPWAVASAVTPQSFAPWSSRAPASAVSAAPSQLRWQLGQTPATPHPMSAIPSSMAAHIESAFDEPKSAVTPSSRKRRRNGPAVSSAWPSANAPGAKPRGRPPASRNVQDGPFGTFPADPQNQKSKAQQSTPIVAEDAEQAPVAPQSAGSRPGRLSLRVPPHTGGPVRLATPPALQVNGETKELETRSDSDDPNRGLIVTNPQASAQIVPRTGPEGQVAPKLSFEALKRILTSDLLRADVIGRRQRFTGDEAKRLADSMLERLSVPRKETGSAQDDTARMSAASWLGVGDQVNATHGLSAGHGKRINVTRFRTDADGYEEIIYEEDDRQEGREVFDVFWRASMGGCIGTFEMKGLSISAQTGDNESTTETMHDLMLRKSIEAIYRLDKNGWVENSMQEVAQSAARTSQAGDDKIDWKAKCKAMEFAANVAKGEVDRARKRWLEKILDAVL